MNWDSVLKWSSRRQLHVYFPNRGEEELRELHGRNTQKALQDIQWEEVANIPLILLLLLMSDINV